MENYLNENGKNILMKVGKIC